MNTAAMDPVLQKLTLAIPIYNEGRYLREAIESCLGQAGKILLCDNASTDDSGEICARIAAEHPEVAHLRGERNIGAFENFKAPLFDCETEYFCWIGGHDRIAPGYTLKLVKEMERDAGIALAAGTIQHIDEQGIDRKQRTCSTFLDAASQSEPLDRLEALASHLRDCFIFHGVYRAAILREAWFDQACLGFDRVTLFRVGAIGKIAYVPEALIYGRDFPKDRDSKQDRERRSQVIAAESAKPLSTSNFTRNQQLILTTLAQATDDRSLSRALAIVDKIKRRQVERRKCQRQRLLRALGALLIIAAFVILLIFRP